VKSKKKKIYFQNHVEIDKFVQKIIDFDPMWMQSLKYQEDFRLLKSLDRAFWLRHLKDKKKKEYQFQEYDPIKGDTQVCKCPFGDPRASKSFGVI